jgi:hypothetical protein
VTHLGSCATGPSITQQSCPSVQQLVPQHVVAAVQPGPVVVQGGFSHFPSAQVDFGSVQWLPQVPQLKGSSSVSVHSPAQQTWPWVHATAQLPASAEPPLLEPLELPELPPLLEPLELPELPPLLEPLELPELPLPLLEPPELPLLEPLEPPLDEPLPPPEPLPLELASPCMVASTDASGGGALSESLVPPQRTVKATRPARPTLETKEERMKQPPRHLKPGSERAGSRPRVHARARGVLVVNERKRTRRQEK